MSETRDGQRYYDTSNPNDVAQRNWSEFESLKVKNAKLKEALTRHKHTDKCWEYAVKTALNCGCYHCIADCTDSHRQALKEAGNE